MTLKNNRTMLKNIVCNKILEIKDRKKKPKLGDLLKLFRGKRDELIEKMEFLYSRKEDSVKNTSKFD